MKIVTDSGADLSFEECQNMDVTMLPLKIVIGENSYQAGVDIDPNEFYDMMDTSPTMPKTSTPSIGEFQQAYEELAKEDPEILSIHIALFDVFVLVGRHALGPFHLALDGPAQFRGKPLGDHGPTFGDLDLFAGEAVDRFLSQPPDLCRVGLFHQGGVFGAFPHLHLHVDLLVRHDDPGEFPVQAEDRDHLFSVLVHLLADLLPLDEDLAGHALPVRALHHHVGRKFGGKGRAAGKQDRQHPAGQEFYRLSESGFPDHDPFPFLDKTDMVYDWDCLFPTGIVQA